MGHVTIQVRRLHEEVAQQRLTFPVGLRPDSGVGPAFPSAYNVPVDFGADVLLVVSSWESLT